MPGFHTAKQRRQARHVADSERKRGMSSKEAESVGWATVNARKAKKSIAVPNMMSEPMRPSPPPPPPAPPSRGPMGGTAMGPQGNPQGKSMKAKNRLKKMDGGGNTYGSMGDPGIGKAGVNYDDASGPVSTGATRKQSTRGVFPHRMEASRRASNEPKMPKVASAVQREQGRGHLAFGKALRVMSLDEYYDSVTKADTVDMQSRLAAVRAPGGAAPAPKKFPRGPKPTVKMKPISDEEAMANLKAGKHTEKSLDWKKDPYGGGNHYATASHGTYSVAPMGGSEHLAGYFRGGSNHNHTHLGVHPTRAAAMGAVTEHHLTKMSTKKALQTGYGKVSGGGALKAPNRGYSNLTVGDLNRAMETMAPPTKVGPPKVYLPGVHNPKSPVRGQMGLKRPKPGKSVDDDKAHKLKKMVPTINASLRPSVVSKKSPRALDGGGAALLANALSEPSLKKSQNVVQKSEGAPTMGKTNFNDIFKSELGIANDDVLCDCPHCEAPITKSDLAKAKGHKGKGAKTHLTGAERGKSSAHVVDQNPTGGVMRGGEGKGVLSPSRGVPGAQKHDAVIGVQNSKGSKHAKKAIDDSSSGDDDSSSDDASSDDKPNPFEKKKDVKKGITLRGTDVVQYIDYGDAPGSDAAIAKSILEGSLGGTPPTQPLDMNNDLTRLLI